jgi:hypothetical protein
VGQQSSLGLIHELPHLNLAAGRRSRSCGTLQVSEGQKTWASNDATRSGDGQRRMRCYVHRIGNALHSRIRMARSSATAISDPLRHP